MLHFPVRPRHAHVRLSRAAALATFTLTMASCSPDDTFELDTSTITVQVRDADNAAVAGAQVTWWPAELAEEQGTIAGTTGASGNVIFDVLTAWEDIRIRVAPPAGFGVPDTQANPVDAALQAGATTVTFRVVVVTP